jgi:formylglycine-generating enzyme required for sulfatase activity
MHGNISEWCKDDYVQTIRGGVNPEVTTGGSERAVRGGSWNDNPTACRCSDRFGSSPSRGYVNLGFRVALCAVRQAAPGEGREEPANIDK